MDEEKWSSAGRLKRIEDDDRRRARRAGLLRQALSTVAAGGMGVLVAHIGESTSILVGWLLLVPWMAVSVHDGVQGSWRRR